MLQQTTYLILSVKIYRVNYLLMDKTPITRLGKLRIITVCL